ncbi:MAG: hypothetical protein IT373_02765 [Polyangiaceae bacterium]|nr:hypothetical protein [Polyangiaceae bacterium]
MGKRNHLLDQRGGFIEPGPLVLVSRDPEVVPRVFDRAKTVTQRILYWASGTRLVARKSEEGTAVIPGQVAEIRPKPRRAVADGKVTSKILKAHGNGVRDAGSIERRR